jgi:hypothetical protein
MPNATVGANARTTPKPPPPGSRESIRRQVDDIKTARALLKQARGPIERLERDFPEPAEPKGPFAGREYGDLEGKVLDVWAWASVAWEMWCEVPLNGATRDQTLLGRERLDRVLEQVQLAANALRRAYYGRPEDEDGDEAEAPQ